MKKFIETIKNFFSQIQRKQFLPSVIVRSGLPELYRGKIDWGKPKGFFKKFTDQLKNFFKDK